MGRSAPSLLQLNMKFLTVLAGLSFVAAKPQFGKDLRLTEGRIIGGEEGQLALFDRIVAGAHNRNLEPGHQSRGISSMEFHESWNDPAFDHDICIVTVNEPFDFKDPNVQPVDFFKTADAEIPPETICNSTGWGLT